jgi:spore coat protein I
MLMRQKMFILLLRFSVAYNLLFLVKVLRLARRYNMQGMDRVVSEIFGLETRSLVPYKDTFMVVTSQGRKVVRKVPFSPERLLFVHGAKEHLAENGFKGIDRYLCTVDGQPCFSFDNNNYTLTDFIDGRECSFENDGDVKRAAVALAEMHRASRGYRAPGGCKVQDDLGKLPGYFSKRLDDIRKMKKQAKRGKGRFDQLFLEYVNYFCELGEGALEELNASGYDGLAERTKEEGLFCHHDYTHHNILLDAEKVTIVNFDYCCFELKVYDIANFIRRKMRKCEWDFSKTGLILDSYRAVEPLSNEELAVLKTILQFPQKFWRVVNRYYNSRRSWSERSFVARLQEVVDETGPHGEFIKQYASRFL